MTEDHNHWDDLERERASRQALEDLLLTKSSEYAESERQWMEFLLEMEKRLSVEMQRFRSKLTEGLCQDVSAMRYFSATKESHASLSAGLDQIQDRASDVLRVVENSPFLAFKPSWDESSQAALNGFMQLLPKSGRTAFLLLLTRMLNIWPIWENGKKVKAKLILSGKQGRLELQGKRTQPLGNRLADALFCRTAAQLGVLKTEISQLDGKLTVVFHVQ